jgi:hypothetical protein
MASPTKCGCSRAWTCSHETPIGSETTMDISAARWRKSSHSNPDGPQCVEVVELRGEAAVRDTQNRALGHLAYPSLEWMALLATLKP